MVITRMDQHKQARLCSGTASLKAKKNFTQLQEDFAQKLRSTSGKLRSIFAQLCKKSLKLPSTPRNFAQLLENFLKLRSTLRNFAQTSLNCDKLLSTSRKLHSTSESLVQLPLSSRLNLHQNLSFSAQHLGAQFFVALNNRSFCCFFPYSCIFASINILAG